MKKFRVGCSSEYCGGVSFFSDFKFDPINMILTCYGICFSCGKRARAEITMEELMRVRKKNGGQDET